MRDPHVDALAYRIEGDEDTSFENPPLVECERPEFRMRLEGGIARFEMIGHYATEKAAREPVESFLRAWVISTALDFGRREIGYQFQSAQVIDRDPPPPGNPQVIEVGSAVLLVGTGEVTVHMTRRKYPAPPEGFAASPDVEMLWSRSEGYRQGREPLPGMAFFCLTFLEYRAGNRDQAARKYSIAGPILDTLGRLTSETGDVQTARKFPKGKPPRPVTGPEKAWIEAAIKAIIRRVGEHDYDPTAARRQLTMIDLPQLPTT